MGHLISRIPLLLPLVSADAEERRIAVAPSGLQHVHTPTQACQIRLISGFGTCFSPNNVQNMN